MKEYEVYITLTEKYIVEADSEQEAITLASRGDAGDPIDRWDEQIQVEDF
jgi:hypothetical protein